MRSAETTVPLGPRWPEREEEMERNGDWMQTFTGRQFWPLDPRSEEVSIVDISHSLAHQCRYAGHCRSFYSVAQHSVIVSHACNAEDALWGLLHDAAEAYLVDLPRPIKRFSDLGTHYKAMEMKLMRVICEHFKLPVVEPESVGKADNVVLVTEMRDLMAKPPVAWKESWGSEPLPTAIYPLSPEVAKRQFLDRFEELKRQYRRERDLSAQLSEEGHADSQQNPGA